MKGPGTSFHATFFIQFCDNFFCNIKLTGQISLLDCVYLPKLFSKIYFLCPAKAFNDTMKQKDFKTLKFAYLKNEKSF